MPSIYISSGIFFGSIIFSLSIRSSTYNSNCFKSEWIRFPLT